MSSIAIQKYDARHAFILLLRAYLGLSQVDCDSVYGRLSKGSAKTSRLVSRIQITDNKETFTYESLGTIRLQMFEVQVEAKKRYLYFAFDLCAKFMWVKVLEQNGQEDIKWFVNYVINAAPYKINTIFVGSNLSFLKNYTIVCDTKASPQIQYIENALQERNSVGQDLVLSDGSWKISVLEDSEHFLQCTKGALQGAITNQGYALPDNPEDCKCSDVRKLFAQISEASSYETSIADTYNDFANIYNNVELGVLTCRHSVSMYHTPNLFILDKHLSSPQSFKANFAELKRCYKTAPSPSGNDRDNIIAMLLLEPWNFKTQFEKCRLLYTKPATFLLHAVAMVGQRKYGIQELNNIKDNANYVLNRAEEILECVKHNNQTKTFYDKVIGDLQRLYDVLLQKISEKQSEMLGPKDNTCAKHGSAPLLDQKAGNSTNGVALKKSGSTLAPLRVPSQKNDTDPLSCSYGGISCYVISDSEQSQDVAEKRRRDNNGPYEGASGKKICLSVRQIYIDSAYNVPLDLRMNKCVLLSEDPNRVTSCPTGEQQADSEGAYIVGCSAAQDVTSGNAVSAVGFQTVHPELQRSELKLVAPSSQEVEDVNVVNLVGVRKFHPRALSYGAAVYDYASPNTMLCEGVLSPPWTDQPTYSNMHR